jgi:hypothetical protein
VAPLAAILVVLLAQTPASLETRFADIERLDRARAAAMSDEDAARLTLAWLRALHDVVESAISDPNLSSRTHPWFRRQTETLHYNEIGGNWLINDQLVWQFHAKYRETAAADDLAWLAARLPKGGECEGYVPCYMAVVNMRSAEYLRRHPSGGHTDEAMRAIIEAIERVDEMLEDYPKLFETSHCTDLMKELAALEDAVQGASGAEQARTSERIHELASRCEPPRSSATGSLFERCGDAVENASHRAIGVLQLALEGQAVRAIDLLVQLFDAMLQQVAQQLGFVRAEFDLHGLTLSRRAPIREWSSPSHWSPPSDLRVLRSPVSRSTAMFRLKKVAV